MTDTQNTPRKEYYAHLDEFHQVIVIEDETWHRVVSRNLPTQVSPNPGRDVLMSYPENMQAWHEVYELAAATWKK